MKNKKIILILAITIILIVLLSIIGLAIGGQFATRTPVLTDEMIEKGNQEERERLLKEKEQFALEHQNDTNSEMINNIEESERDMQFVLEAEERNKFLNKVREIMNRYYSNFDAVVEQQEKESSGLQPLDSELTETNIKFFDMILTVLERKDLPKEDRETLKTFLIDIKHNMENNNDLNQRAEKILQD